MSLSPHDLDRIAKLARLSLEPDESNGMRSKINDFFKIVEKIQSVDTHGIEPLAHPFSLVEEVALRLRDDVVSETNQRLANQRSAPSVERGLFLVPKVIE
jgi:aspartyl-tRNA(Asn)/glutamyl-tRNA(Gln) amidotransferase subunit C